MVRETRIGFLFITILAILFSSCATSPPTTTPRPAPTVKAPPKPVHVSRFMNLSELTDAFAKDLAKDIKERRVYLDSTSIRDISTNDVSNFSAYVQQEIESSLSRRGFIMVYDPSEADYLIGATYRKSGDIARIFLKYHKADLSGRKSLDYAIDISRLPRDSFDENIRSKAYRLAANILMGQNNLRLYIKPIKEGNMKYTSDFSNSFTSRLKTEMVRLRRNVEIIDEKPIYEKLSNTRGIDVKAKEVKNIQTSEAQFCGADTVFEGEYFQGGNMVTVNCYLKDLKGKVLNSASIDIEKGLISASLENPVAEKITEIADTKTEQGNFNVRISTTKGGDSPVYYGGEKIKFYMQVATPLYVYLYNINPYDEVTLLYPYESSMTQHRLMPGRLYVIPAETDAFEFEASPPFGIEGVKIFASDRELPIPKFSSAIPSRSFRGNVRTIEKKRKEIQYELSNIMDINPKDLVDYYRGVAVKYKAMLYEDSLILETKGR